MRERLGLLFGGEGKHFCGMRILLTTTIVALALTASAFAGRLDIAVVQFPEEKGAAELENALAGQSLFETTNADRTVTKVPYLKGGTVVFAQSIGVAPGGSFGGSTRLGNERADVQGSFKNGTVSVTIEVVEGIKAGLRSIQTRKYSGSGALPGTNPGILSMSLVKGKAPYVVKGQAKMETYGLTVVLFAQYTP